MAKTMGLEILSGKKNILFWKISFFALLALLIWGIYLASISVDYTWRWNRIPQYFYYTEKIELTSSVQGEIATISQNGKSLRVVLKAEDGNEEVLLAEKGKILLDEGDFVSPGDVVIEYKKNVPGILLSGLWLTLKVSLLAIIFGLVAGLITGLARISSNPLFRWSAITYIELVRGSPLLVQMFLWYFVVGTLVNSLLAKYGISPIPSFFSRTVCWCVHCRNHSGRYPVHSPGTNGSSSFTRYDTHANYAENHFAAGFSTSFAAACRTIYFTNKRFIAAWRYRRSRTDKSYQRNGFHLIAAV